jgi:copper(I)-binding protein
VNRALRAAVVGVLLLSPVALSACSAGQVAQTAEQNRDKVGGGATIGDLAIRQAHLAYPVSGTYQEGADARLVVAIANGGQADDTLVSITGDSFQSAEVTGTGAAASSAPASGAPASPGTDAGLNVPIPANSNVYIGGDGPVVTLTGLSQAYGPGQTMDVTMDFQRAGEVTVEVLVGAPTRDLPRGKPFDFSEERAEGSDAGAVD